MPPVAHLSFAALDARGTMVGLLQSWPVALTDGKGTEHPLIMVGPVAVLPALQQGGIGQELMRELMAQARASACDPLMMIGDPEYYGRFFGFSAAGTAGWEAPGPVERRRLLAQSVDGRPLPGPGRLGPRSTGLRAAC
jgi:predicted N-acetyltransferase YhbS